jgi:Polycystin cation channel
MQFTVWRYSGKSRIIVEFISTIMMAIAIHVLVNFVLKDSPDFTTKMLKFVQLENQYHSMSFYKQQNSTDPAYLAIETTYIQYGAEIKTTVESFFRKVLVVSYLSFLPLFYGVQHLFNIMYATINKRQVNPYSFLNLIDFLIFSIFLANIIITYAKNLSGTWMDYPLIATDTRAMIYGRNFVNDVYISENALWVIMIVIMWIRVFYFLRYNEFMGKFIGIVERLFNEVLLFFVFYIVQLIFFSLIANICFRKPTDYNTFPQAFKTLFYASLGDFSFDDISRSEKGEYFGITYLIIFLVCNVGIILNIFVAVIAVLYDSYSQNRNVYQMLETLTLRPQTQADKEYSALISVPAPFNCVLIIFAPFLLTSKQP